MYIMQIKSVRLVRYLELNESDAHFSLVCLLAVGAINLIARLTARLEQPSGRHNMSPLHRSLMRTDLGRLAACLVEILTVPDKPCRGSG